MKIRCVFNFVLLAGLSSGALANETYKFDQSRSTIGFAVHQFLGTSHGKFAKFDGKIDIDREHPEKSSVVAKIDVRSIDTGIVKRDNHLRSAEFFNVAKFPEIIFKSSRVRETGQQSGDIFGDQQTTAGFHIEPVDEIKSGLEVARAHAQRRRVFVVAGVRLLGGAHRSRPRCHRRRSRSNISGRALVVVVPRAAPCQKLRPTRFATASTRGGLGHEGREHP